MRMEGKSIENCCHLLLYSYDPLKKVSDQDKKQEKGGKVFCAYGQIAFPHRGVYAVYSPKGQVYI